MEVPLMEILMQMKLGKVIGHQWRFRLQLQQNLASELLICQQILEHSGRVTLVSLVVEKRSLLLAEVVQCSSILLLCCSNRAY